MRLKKKYALYFMFFGWSVWYLGFLHAGQDGNGTMTLGNSLDKSPDIFRFQVHEKDELTRIVPQAPVMATWANETINNTLTSPAWLVTHLPHIKDVRYVQPRVKWSQGRTNVSIIIGIPTIKRPTNDEYILDTLESFFNAMNDTERKDAIIVVSITEPWNLEYENDLLKRIKARFSSQLAEGALEVIAPHPQFYPDLNTVKLSLGDPKSRVKWRSKQNLDYGFLMMHCMGKAAYYLQMEDDISTVYGFVTSIKKSVAKEGKKNWMSLSFSQLGYIGRLYKIGSVRGIMEYLLENFDKKPCDWLQYDYLRKLFCQPRHARKACNALINKYTWLIKPTLFQHKGFRSSFQGHINKLQDKYFLRGKNQGMYSNPKPAALLTSLDVHLSHKLSSAYNTKGYFWGKNPRPGDTIEFLYDPPISVSGVAFISGHVKHVHDVIVNATLEVLPEHSLVPGSTNSSLVAFDAVPLRTRDAPGSSALLTNIDEYRVAALPQLKGPEDNPLLYVIGHFKDGRVESHLGESAGKISLIRIRFLTSMDHWVILDQILVL